MLCQYPEYKSLFKVYKLTFCYNYHHFSLTEELANVPWCPEEKEAEDGCVEKTTFEPTEASTETTTESDIEGRHILIHQAEFICNK